MKDDEIYFVEYCPLPPCGAPRAKGGKVTCEQPEDHEKSQGHYFEHMGRDRAGRWHSWKTSR